MKNSTEGIERKLETKNTSINYGHAIKSDVIDGSNNIALKKIKDSTNL